nr:sigma-70 family RNA polymerase sigma factor [Acidimicrobiia bacterium]
MVARGNEVAFEALYARHRDGLHRYCLSILRRPEDAEEAVQAAMLSAYQSLQGRPRQDLAVRAWLYRIAHNACIDQLRARPDACTELSDCAPSAEPGPGERAELRQELAQLVRDLDQLPGPQRAALLLRELSGLSHREIALTLGVPAEAAKQLIYEARLALADFAAGRDMCCREVRTRLAEGDRRVLRARSVRAHLRDCSCCAEVEHRVRERRHHLAALFPAPLPIAGGILPVLGGGMVGAGTMAGLGGKAVVAAIAIVAAGSAAVTLPSALTGPPAPAPHEQA